VRGATLFTGYLGRPDATAACFAAGGWFRTGDAAVVELEINKARSRLAEHRGREVTGPGVVGPRAFRRWWISQVRGGRR
jgi:acyl-CoA synthetase (AMP-forming)/AMP-acid ligase II